MGYDHKYVYRHAGYNLKVTEMQAAIGLAQLDKLDGFVAARRRNWATLRAGLAELEEEIILPAATERSEPSWFGFLITLRNPEKHSRDKLVRFLESRNIQTRMLFAGNLTRQPVLHEGRFQQSYRVVGELKNTDKIMRDTFWLGVYPGLKAGMLEYMIESVREFIRS